MEFFRNVQRGSKNSAKKLIELETSGFQSVALPSQLTSQVLVERVFNFSFVGPPIGFWTWMVHLKSIEHGSTRILVLGPIHTKRKWKRWKNKSQTSKKIFAFRFHLVWIQLKSYKKCPVSSDGRVPNFIFTRGNFCEYFSAIQNSQICTICTNSNGFLSACRPTMNFITSCNPQNLFQIFTSKTHVFHCTKYKTQNNKARCINIMFIFSLWSKQ